LFAGRRGSAASTTNELILSLILDTGIVFAYYDRSDSWHSRARSALKGRERTLILPAPVIPEIDHLLGRRLGAASRQVFYQGIVEGHYYVADVPRQAYRRIADIDRQFPELDIGFVDAAIVTVAASLNVRRIATTDRRHFPPLAQAFNLELVP
jgi:predicted nucleic acid-binding protein